jgi:hypothetical protein
MRMPLSAPRARGSRRTRAAERLGNELLAALLTQGKMREQGGLTLIELWTKFSRECVEWMDNAPSTRRDDERRALTLLAHFGDDCDVRTLTPNDVAIYAQGRRKGGIKVIDRKGEPTTTRAVRSRAVECDVKLLRAMLRWATTVRTQRGARRLLEANPLDGLKLERERIRSGRLQRSSASRRHALRSPSCGTGKRILRFADAGCSSIWRSSLSRRRVDALGRFGSSSGPTST